VCLISIDDQIERGNSESLGEVILRGEIICPGIAIGPAFLLEPKLLVAKKDIPSDQVGSEQSRYTAAVRLVQKQFAERVRAGFRREFFRKPLQSSPPLMPCSLIENSPRV